MTDDDLDRLLAPPATGPDRRAEVLRLTVPRVARRRWRSRFTIVGVFAVGVAAGWAAKPSPVIPPAVVEVIAVPVWSPPPPSAPPPDPYVTADRLELAAELADDPAEAARLYKQAGDLYLTAAAEPGQAARCYRLHLQRAGPAGLDYESADSWLLASLKSQRRSEVRDASGSGS